MTTPNTPSEEINQCKECETIKHTNDDELCGRCSAPIEDELEKFMPRCKTADHVDFPTIKDDERCWNCELWEKIDSHTNKQRLDARIDELSAIRGKFNRENWSFDRAVDNRLAQLKAERSKLDE